MLLKTIAVEGGVGSAPVGVAVVVVGSVVVGAVVVGAVVVGAVVVAGGAVGAVVAGELGWPVWLALAPLPQATLRDRQNVSMPKRSFFI
jgi:hypothetical protein